jgi:opacity protein-like surface antigen
MNRQTRAHTLLRGAAAAVSALLAFPTQAAWEVAPALELTAITDDNVRLVPEASPFSGGAESMSLDTRLRATSTSQRGSLYIEPRLRMDEYTGEDHEDLNGLDRFLRMRAGYNWTQVAFNVLADYDRQDLKDAELTEALPDDPNFGDPLDPDTGLVLTDEDRVRMLLRPSLDIRLSDRSSLIFESDILDVSYTGDQAQGRVDFKDTRLATGIRRQVDARNEVTARLIASEFAADAISNETRTFGVQGNFNRELTRDWAFSLAAGVNRSDYTFLNPQLEPVENADTSFTYLIGLRQRTDRNRLNIDLSREASPNSSGFLSLRDQLRVYVGHAFTQRLTGDLGLRAHTTKTLDDVVDDDERDYLRVDLGLEWAMTEQLFINGGYVFTSQRFGDSVEDASSNQVFIGFAYRARTRQ